MNRTTIKELDNLVDRLNSVAETQNEHYALDGAYGGWKLVKKDVNGGTREVTHSGYTTKSQLYREIQAFLNGYCTAKE